VGSGGLVNVGSARSINARSVRGACGCGVGGVCSRSVGLFDSVGWLVLRILLVIISGRNDID
jgi:hypothetical protein